MSVALLDSVRHAEGSRGVHTYLSAKLHYMPSHKPRKAPVKTDDAIAAVKRALDHYLTEEQPFSLKELCDRANVSESWLYRKDNPTVVALFKDVKEAQNIVGKGGYGRSQTRPPEPEPEPEQDVDAIARQWLDTQIEVHKRSLESLQERQAALEAEQQSIEQRRSQVEQELSHLFEVRQLAQPNQSPDSSAL